MDIDNAEDDNANGNGNGNGNGGNANGNVHPRDDNQNNNNGRNVRRNVNQGQAVRSVPFQQLLPLEMSNIVATRPRAAGATARRQFNPNSILTSLTQLQSEGTRHGKLMIGIVLTIAAVSNATSVQQRSNGNRGHSNNIRHTRRVVVMDPLSPSGSNTAMILQGNGMCTRLFEGDLSNRDSGALRKLFLFHPRVLYSFIPYISAAD